MGDYNTIWIFLMYLIQRVIFQRLFRISTFSWFMAGLSDLSMFPKLAKNLKFTSVSNLEALWKLPVTRQFVTNILILLIKSIASLPKPLWFKCNPPLLSLFEVIFPFSMTSICKSCKCSFVLITVEEALPLSVLVIKLEMTTLLSSKVCSINFFRLSNLSNNLSSNLSSNLLSLLSKRPSNVQISNVQLLGNIYFQNFC